MNSFNSIVENQAVKLSDIDHADNTYRITTQTDVGNLKQSIKRVGLLNPPFLAKNNTSYTVISGFRRIEACRSLNRSHIPARILLNHETQKLRCAKLAVTDNALQRPLNLIEQSRAIRLISGFFKKESDLFQELSVLGLPSNQTITNKVKKLCYFSNAIQNALLSNVILLPTALKLGALTPAAGTGFVELFENLKPSLNKQREIITLVKEIALRDDLSIAEVLNEKHLQGLLNQPELDRNQKTRMIRSYLKKRRFPNITRAETAFGLLIKELKLGKHAKLIAPNNFEGLSYHLTFNFENLKQLKDCKTTLDSIIQNPAFKSFLNR